MARIRSIHPGLWTDDEFVALTLAARLFIIELGTISDYADRFIWSAASKRSEEALEQLLDAGLIRRDGEMGEILFAFGFSRRRISKWEAIRSAVFERDGFACTYCGNADAILHCDHIHPVSRGGSNDMSNLTTACSHCNLSKGDRTVEEWQL